MKFIAQFKNIDYLINLNKVHGNHYVIEVDSNKYSVQCLILRDNYSVLSVNNSIMRVVYFPSTNNHSNMDMLVDNKMSKISIFEENIFSLSKILQKFICLNPKKRYNKK